MVRCGGCLLNQFRTANDLCRKCGERLTLPVVELGEGEELLEPQVHRVRRPRGPGIAAQMAQVIFLQRSQMNITQSMLGVRIGVPRTYVSKLENGGAMPSLNSLKRIADGLGLPAWMLVKRAEEAAAFEVRA